MKRQLSSLLLCIGGIMLPHAKSVAQVTLLQDYKNNYSPVIGTFQGISFREAGFSGLYAIPNTNGKEFWTCSDRGVNVDAASANPAGCTPTYDKIYGFASYAPKIHRIRLNGDSVQILQTITMKRPDGTNATGLLNPTGFGSTATEQASTDTVLNCANFSSKIAPKDVWGIDAEGIVVDRDGYFWICEEGGPTIWKLSPNGVVLKRYSPYANLPGAQSIDVAIDTVYKYRKNNRGFEGITIAPNGKIYAAIQSPLLYPTTAIGENSRVHRILEINPVTNATRMFAYLNDGIIGTGANQIRLRDWKLGDMAAINDSTMLVMEAALRGTTDVKKIYKININSATPVTSALYGGLTLEGLADSAGLAANSIVPVKKTLVINLLTSGWNPALDKAEGLAILNDSTVFVANDNDYGQTSPSANGVATATTNLSHVVKFGLQGSSKLTGFQPLGSALSLGVTGPSTGNTPYLVPTVPGLSFTSILTAGETVGSYKMCGTPDGLGAFDNNDGTFTLLMNHEFGNTAGATRAHGSAGAFVSKWVINKSTLSVVSGSDLMSQINLWNPLTSSFITYSGAFPTTSAALNRFCSGDLAPVSAFYNATTGKGTQARIYLNGEEAGNEGRAFGHIASGTSAGKSYELPYLGKFSWENAVASPVASDSTVVIGMDDATPGQVYVYVGTKTTAGTDIDKAGLNNGRLYGVTVTGLTTEVSASVPAAASPFTLTDMGSVQNMTGNALNNASNTAGVTSFLRPEDGAWDPSSPNDFYFATTNSITSPSRLWRLRFNNAANPALGGNITAVLDGTEGQKMLDNITIDNYGHILLVEDVGNNAHVGRVWQYTIATDMLTQIATHDTTRFLAGGANYLTQDEEASGILDVESILGPGMFLTVDQAHYAVAGEVVEGGQLLAFFNPTTYNAAPEIAVSGNALNITDGDVVPSVYDNTLFGNVTLGTTNTRDFVIKNTGVGSLDVAGVTFAGANAADFTLVSAPTFPFSVATGATQILSVKFTPTVTGTRTATIKIANNDASERIFDFALAGTGVFSPEINIQGNGTDIADGDATPGSANNTDFGSVDTGSQVAKSFVIQNTGMGNLSVNGITISGINASDFALVGAPAMPLVIPTAGSYTVNMSFTPSAPGMRYAVVTLNNNDADENIYDFHIQGNGTTVPVVNGVGSVAAFSSVNLFPNPARNTATLSISLSQAADLTISVLDVQGKEAMPAISKALKAGAQSIELSTAALPNGVYFVRVADGSTTHTTRLVVMH